MVSEIISTYVYKTGILNGRWSYSTAVGMYSEILIGYRNTIFYTIFGTGISIVLTTLAAYVLSRKRLKGKGFFTMFIVFTMFFQGGMIPNYLLLQSLHMTDTIWALLLPLALSKFKKIFLSRLLVTRESALPPRRADCP
jgi:ABC-type glycerol-3-phosphate transport system permease component